MAVLAAGTAEQRAMAQGAIDRWWWPTLMMFGPPDAVSTHSDLLLRWRVKQMSNDELRQWFVDLTVPQVREIGLEVPDPELHFDAASGQWRTGPIDWDEFWRVVRGGGICNRDRLEARKAAHEAGRWVREAAEAYAKKRRA
jgi:ring-1,2-phenylacetyl-CoA epoxidase subunit PaaA